MPSLNFALERIPKGRLVVHILDWLLLAGAVALAGYGQVLFADDNWQGGTLAFGGAMILFAWAARREKTPEPATIRRPAGAIPRGQRIAGLGMLVAALTCLVG